MKKIESILCIVMILIFQVRSVSAYQSTQAQTLSAKLVDKPLKELIVQYIQTHSVAEAFEVYFHKYFEVGDSLRDYVPAIYLLKTACRELPGCTIDTLDDATEEVLFGNEVGSVINHNVVMQILLVAIQNIIIKDKLLQSSELIQKVLHLFHNAFPFVSIREEEYHSHVESILSSISKDEYEKFDLIAISELYNAGDQKAGEVFKRKIANIIEASEQTLPQLIDCLDGLYGKKHFFRNEYATLLEKLATKYSENNLQKVPLSSLVQFLSICIRGDEKIFDAYYFPIVHEIGKRFKAQKSSLESNQYLKNLWVAFERLVIMSSHFKDDEKEYVDIQRIIRSILETDEFKKTMRSYASHGMFETYYKKQTFFYENLYRLPESLVWLTEGHGVIQKMFAVDQVLYTHYFSLMLNADAVGDIFSVFIESAISRELDALKGYLEKVFGKSYLVEPRFGEIVDYLIDRERFLKGREQSVPSHQTKEESLLAQVIRDESVKEDGKEFLYGRYGNRFISSGKMDIDFFRRFALLLVTYGKNFDETWLCNSFSYFCGFILTKGYFLKDVRVVKILADNTDWHFFVEIKDVDASGYIRKWIMLDLYPRGNGIFNKEYVVIDIKNATPEEMKILTEKYKYFSNGTQDISDAREFLGADDYTYSRFLPPGFNLNEFLSRELGQLGLLYGDNLSDNETSLCLRSA